MVLGSSTPFPSVLRNQTSSTGAQSGQPARFSDPPQKPNTPQFPHRQPRSPQPDPQSQRRKEADAEHAQCPLRGVTPENGRRAERGAVELRRRPSCGSPSQAPISKISNLLLPTQRRRPRAGGMDGMGGGARGGARGGLQTSGASADVGV